MNIFKLFQRNNFDYEIKIKASKPKQIIMIEPQHEMELRQLLDKYLDNENNEHANSYAFWSKAAKYYPVLELGNWEIKFTGLGGYFEEVQKK